MVRFGSRVRASLNWLSLIPDSQHQRRRFDGKTQGSNAQPASLVCCRRCAEAAAKVTQNGEPLW